MGIGDWGLGIWGLGVGGGGHSPIPTPQCPVSILYFNKKNKYNINLIKIIY